MNYIYTQLLKLAVHMLLFAYGVTPATAQNLLGHPASPPKAAAVAQAQLWGQQGAKEIVSVFDQIEVLDAFIVYLPEGLTLMKDKLSCQQGALPSWMEYYSYDHSLKGMAPLGSEGTYQLELPLLGPQGVLTYRIQLTILSQQTYFTHSHPY